MKYDVEKMKYEDIRNQSISFKIMFLFYHCESKDICFTNHDYDKNRKQSDYYNV